MPATVLVVDDDRDLTRLMTKFLKLEGFAAAEAYNGQEALKYLRNGGDASVILLDLRMPVMDGYEFAREVRTHSPCRQVRLVAVTAIRDPIAYTRTWSAGYDAHLEKPLTVKKLEDLAARLLSGGASER